jgi:dihydrofolate reductase
MKLSIIACVSENLELGINNDLVFHIKEDMKYFKELTLNHIVVMGRRTFESLPGVLPKRRNIVLQLPNESKLDGVEIFNSIPDILDNIKDEDEAFIIGGASIYRQFLPYAKKLYLTEVTIGCKDPDVYFPKFDKRKYKKTIVGNGEDGGIKYNFVIYERRK